jgi:hypothetical protein
MYQINVHLKKTSEKNKNKEFHSSVLSFKTHKHSKDRKATFKLHASGRRNQQAWRTYVHYLRVFSLE